MSADDGAGDGRAADAGESTRATIYDVYKAPEPATLRRLPALAARSVRLVWAAAPREFATVLVCEAVSGVGLVAPILAGRDVLAILTTGEPPSIGAALSAVGLVLAGGVLVNVFNVLSSARSFVLGELVSAHAFRELLDVTGRVELEAFDHAAFHDRLQLASMSAGYRPFNLVQGLLALGGGVLGLVGVVLALAALQPAAVPFALLAAVPLLLAGIRKGQAMFAFFFRLTPSERERGYLFGLLSMRDHAKEVRVFGLARYLRGRWEQRTGERFVELRKMSRRRLRLDLAASLGGAALLAAAVGILLVLAFTGGMSLPDAGAATAAVLLLGRQLRSAAIGTDLLFEAAPFVEDLTEFLASAPATPMASQNQPPAPERFERLVVEGVSFAYPSSERPALREVSLELRAGEVIALVGENGSGKTTLAKLLSRLYLPQSGRILWDGVDLATMAPEAVRRAVAVLFQDFYRYRLTAADNVAMGRCEAAGDRAGIVAAAVKAGADAFLAELPRGYDSILGPEFEGGTDLSLGQWQRVALARAFFRDVPFVILDEPTAALDARAEHELFGRIRTLFADRTVLLISHRFSTVRNADRIYVLAEGRLVEAGGHDELMALGGRYAELFTLQASSYTDA